MTSIRAVAAYEVVRQAFPRPITEADELGIAEGRAIDSALAKYGYELTLGRRPTSSSIARFAEATFDEEASNAHLGLSDAARSDALRRITEVVRVYRKSPLAGLGRPKSRLVVLDQEAGFYAQPDYWDRVGTIFEMKSYHAVPRPPDVQLQLDLFQMAFPGFVERLICLDRHASPVTVTDEVIPPMAVERRREVLDLAYRTARELGTEKVLAFVDSPQVHLRLER